MSQPELSPLELAKLIQAAAEDKLAQKPVRIPLKGKTTVADYFVVCEGETDRQVKAIADGIVERTREHGVRPLAVDGYEDASWVLIDFDSVLVHIFLPGERSFYDLESLWSTAARRRGTS
ncbi:MAG TPA: ribosome silencing factor [Candidatus Dormibacteraeota bacterium]